MSDAAWSRVVEDVQNYPRGRPRIDGRESSNDGPDDGSMQSDAGHASRQACVRSLASTPVALRDPRASQTRARRPTVPTKRSESKSQRPSGPQPPEGAESGGPTPRGLGGHRVPPRVADEPCHGPHARQDTETRDRGVPRDDQIATQSVAGKRETWALDHRLTRDTGFMNRG